MKNFTHYNPTKIVFGKDTIKSLEELLPDERRILIVYGGGSIKKNGVYDQVINSTKGKTVFEFSGIECNPSYSTCIKAVELVKKENIDFILAVGGGSVLDAVKFIAAAGAVESNDYWELIVKKGIIEKVIDFGTVLTLPATSSEMNCKAVISNLETHEKLPINNPLLYPVFSILDPETTYSLPLKQVANGVVDTYVHVLEQYLTTDLNTAVQDRWSESLLTTLIELADKVMREPNDYDSRANLMFAALFGNNGFIGLGVDQDWATHKIGHEITAMYGVDHAQSLAIVLPGLLSLQRKSKQKKLLAYARNVWGITMGDSNVVIDEAITRTSLFFQSVGISGRFVDYKIDPEEAAEAIGNIFIKRDSFLGENQDISGEVVKKILLNRQCLYS